MTLSIDAPVADAVEEVAAADIQPAAGPAVTKWGDVWRLGPHVVGCGDVRDADICVTLWRTGRRRGVHRPAL